LTYNSWRYDARQYTEEQIAEAFRRTFFGCRDVKFPRPGPNVPSIGCAPRDHPLGVEAFEIPEQQETKVPTRRKTRSTYDLGIERRARALDERIELRLVEHSIQPAIERVRRTPRQILRGHPHRRLARPPLAFADRHAQSLGHVIDAVDR
jgi:hypothetical protein